MERRQVLQALLAGSLCVALPTTTRAYVPVRRATFSHTNLYDMFDEISLHVRKTGDVVLSHDDQYRRVLGFEAKGLDGSTRWEIHLTHVIERHPPTNPRWVPWRVQMIERYICRPRGRVLLARSLTRLGSGVRTDLCVEEAFSKPS